MKFVKWLFTIYIIKADTLHHYATKLQRFTYAKNHLTCKRLTYLEEIWSWVPIDFEHNTGFPLIFERIHNIDSLKLILKKIKI